LVVLTINSYRAKRGLRSYGHSYDNSFTAGAPSGLMAERVANCALFGLRWLKPTMLFVGLRWLKSTALL
jgi:hypothetical protein